MSNHNLNATHSAPIGVFDSGVGGLTVLKALQAALPGEHFIYFADRTHVPYGDKDPEAVRNLTLQISDFLVARGVKLIVIACTTASAVAADAVRKHVSPIPVIDVIEEGVQAVFEALPESLTSPGEEESPPRAARIALTGTELTVKSGIYRRRVEERAARLRLLPPLFMEQACPLFVTLVEQGIWEGPEVDRAAARYLEKIRAFRPDLLILGCTHFRVLLSAIADAVGPEVPLVDSAAHIAAKAKNLLRQSDQLREGQEKGTLTLFTNDTGETFQRYAERFLDRGVDMVHHVKPESTEGPAPSVRPVDHDNL